MPINADTLINADTNADICPEPEHPTRSYGLLTKILLKHEKSRRVNLHPFRSA